MDMAILERTRQAKQSLKVFREIFRVFAKASTISKPKQTPKKENKKRRVFGVDKSMSPQERLPCKQCGRCERRGCAHPAFCQTIKQIYAKLKRKEVDQMPRGCIVHAERLKSRYEWMRKDNVGRSAVGVICSAGAVSVLKVEVSAEPFLWRIGIAKRTGVIVKERLIPG